MAADWQNALTPYLENISGSVFIQTLIVLTASLILAFIVDKVFLTWLKKLVGKVDQENPLLQTRRGPLFYSVMLLGFWLSLRIINLGDELIGLSESVLMTLTILIWARFLQRFSRFILRSLADDSGRVAALNSKSLPLFENTAFIVIITITVYYVFINWNVDMTAWLASAGIIGIAVGFAAKDTLANLFSGIFIMADAPYKIGDMVVIDSGERGTITKIGIRSTRMVTRDDLEVTIPNSIMGNSKIVNESSGNRTPSRIRVPLSVAYGCDIDQVEEVLMAVGNNEANACKDPAPRVRFRRFGASGLEFELLCWIEDPAIRGRVLDSLNGAVYKAFIAAGIEIPYAKQDIYIKELPSKDES